MKYFLRPLAVVALNFFMFSLSWKCRCFSSVGIYKEAGGLSWYCSLFVLWMMQLYLFKEPLMLHVGSGLGQIYDLLVNYEDKIGTFTDWNGECVQKLSTRTTPRAKFTPNPLNSLFKRRDLPELKILFSLSHRPIYRPTS